MTPKDPFIGQTVRISNLCDTDVTYDYDNLDSHLMGRQPSVKLMGSDGVFQYVALLATDYTYDIQWNAGMDFDHMLVYPSYEYEENEKTIVLRFKYIADRETFDVFRMSNGEQLTKTYN